MRAAFLHCQSSTRTRPESDHCLGNATPAACAAASPLAPPFKRRRVLKAAAALIDTLNGRFWEDGQLFNHDFRFSTTDNRFDRIGIKYIGGHRRFYARSTKA